MSFESVALTSVYEAAWLPADEERWRAYLGCDEYLDAPAEVVFYLPGVRSAGVRRRLTFTDRRRSQLGGSRRVGWPN